MSSTRASQSVEDAARAQLAKLARDDSVKRAYSPRKSLARSEDERIAILMARMGEGPAAKPPVVARSPSMRARNAEAVQRRASLNAPLPPTTDSPSASTATGAVRFYNVHFASSTGEDAKEANEERRAAAVVAAEKMSAMHPALAPALIPTATAPAPATVAGSKPPTTTASRTSTAVNAVHIEDSDLDLDVDIDALDSEF
jgi:hypothetical protein